MDCISIITVVYNAENTIERCVLSVLDQITPDAEYIIVDGSSKDTTVSKIKDLIHCHPASGQIVFVSEPDEGIYYAMNKALNMARGEYVWFINADDYLEPKALKEVLIAAYENPDIITGLLSVVDSNGEILGVYLNSIRSVGQVSMAHPSTIVKKRLMSQLHNFDTSYRSSSDLDFFVRLSKLNPVEKIIEKNLAFFSFGNGVSSGLEAKIETLKIKKNYRIISLKNFLFFYCYFYIKNKIQTSVKAIRKVLN